MMHTGVEIRMTSERFYGERRGNLSSLNPD